MATYYSKQELIAWVGRREGGLLHLLVTLNDYARIRLLLAKNTSYLRAGDAEDATALHYASAVANAETVKLLLAFGAKVNAVTAHEETPLLWALIEPRPEERQQKIAQLIKARARINHANMEGETPLHQSFRDAAITDLLLKHGADVHAQNIYQWTPLHYTCLYDDFIKNSEQLLAYDADPNVPDDEGLTPLHLTIQNGSPETARLLIKAGANRKAKNCDGLTPYDLAREQDAPDELIALLKY